jgi:hypothetical protein
VREDIHASDGLQLAYLFFYKKQLSVCTVVPFYPIGLGKNDDGERQRLPLHHPGWLIRRHFPKGSPCSAPTTCAIRE